MSKRNISIDTLLSNISWDLNIIDIVCPINQVGVRYNSTKFPSKISLVDQFEKEFNKSIDSKKKELLFSGLRYYKKEVENFKNVPELPNTDDEWYEQSVNYYAYQNLINKIYLAYSNEYNPKLLEFKDSILIALEEGLKQLDFYSTIDDDYFAEKSEQEISFEIISSHVYDKFELVICTIDFLKYLQNKSREFEDGGDLISDSNKKLVWKGKPADFAFIIDLLINKGYLEKPTPFGTRNARILLQYFDFIDDNPTGNSLGNMLHKEIDPIKNATHKAKFLAIPRRDELDK